MADEQPRFQELPDDCTCEGGNMALVQRYARVGPMPELCTYHCSNCGHVETIETDAHSGP